MIKKYKVYFRNRYYKYQPLGTKVVYAKSKASIREMWFEIMDSDEELIVKIEEIKE